MRLTYRGYVAEMIDGKNAFIIYPEGPMPNKNAEIDVPDGVTFRDIARTLINGFIEKQDARRSEVNAAVDAIQKIEGEL